MKMLLLIALLFSALVSCGEPKEHHNGGCQRNLAEYKVAPCQ